MQEIKLASLFEALDSQPRNEGFQKAIDASAECVNFLCAFATKAAVSPATGQVDGNRYARILGTLAGMWKSPDVKVPYNPSSLAQMLTLGGVGAAVGYMGGKLVNRFVPDDVIRADRAGAALGGLLGTTPGLASAYLNWHQGKPVWTDSFWNTKQSSIGCNMYITQPINVQDFQRTMWQDDRIASAVPLNLRAGASGIVQAAANLPGKFHNSSFVTPFDIARVAVGMGSGLASGWLVGKTLGAIFGTGRKTQDLLKNTGMAAGALKAVIPVAFGSEPFSR